MDQVERWAKFVRAHDYEAWKIPLKEFIDSQFIKANRFYKELAKKKNGKDKIERLRKIRLNKLI